MAWKGYLYAMLVVTGAALIGQAIGKNPTDECLYMLVVMATLLAIDVGVLKYHRND